MNKFLGEKSGLTHMYFMYVDESGDSGPYVDKNGGNSPHFILSGLIVSVEDWDGSLKRFTTFRQMSKKITVYPSVRKFMQPS